MPLVVVGRVSTRESKIDISMTKSPGSIYRYTASHIISADSHDSHDAKIGEFCGYIPTELRTPIGLLEKSAGWRVFKMIC